TLTVSAGGIVIPAAVDVVEFVASGFFTSVAVDSSQHTFFVSSEDDTIMLIPGVGQSAAIYAGVPKTPGFQNGPRLQSLFRNPSFLTLNQASGSLYVTDSGNNVIRVITPGQNGVVETLAGTGQVGSIDGPLGNAQFNNPQGISIDNSGNLWVVDS